MRKPLARFGFLGRRLDELLVGAKHESALGTGPASKYDRSNGAHCLDRESGLLN